MKKIVGIIKAYKTAVVKFIKRVKTCLKKIRKSA